MPFRWGGNIGGLFGRMVGLVVRAITVTNFVDNGAVMGDLYRGITPSVTTTSSDRVKVSPAGFLEVEAMGKVAMLVCDEVGPKCMSCGFAFYVGSCGNLTMAASKVGVITVVGTGTVLVPFMIGHRGPCTTVTRGAMLVADMEPAVGAMFPAFSGDPAFSDEGL